jgi:hypothetical protein
MGIKTAPFYLVREEGKEDKVIPTYFQFRKFVKTELMA